jgi:hypothetical protein
MPPSASQFLSPGSSQVLIINPREIYGDPPSLLLQPLFTLSLCRRCCLYKEMAAMTQSLFNDISSTSSLLYVLTIVPMISLKLEAGGRETHIQKREGRYLGRFKKEKNRGLRKFEHSFF